jgi:hypothetical protein
MRENRTYGSEGGAAELNRSSLPLSDPTPRKSEPQRAQRAQRAQSNSDNEERRTKNPHSLARNSLALPLTSAAARILANSATTNNERSTKHHERFECKVQNGGSR